MSSGLPQIGALPASNATSTNAGVGQKRPRPADSVGERDAANMQVQIPPLPHAAAGPKSDWECRLSNFVDNDGKVKPGKDIEGFMKLLDEAKDSDNAVFSTEMLSSMVTDTRLLAKLVKAGLLNPIREWLKDAAAKGDTKWLSEILQLLLRLPTDLPALKASKIGVQVAKLSTKGSAAAAASSSSSASSPSFGLQVAALADRIYESWASAATASTAAAAQAQAQKAASASASTSTSSASTAASADGGPSAKRMKLTGGAADAPSASANNQDAESTSADAMALPVIPLSFTSFSSLSSLSSLPASSAAAAAASSSTSAVNTSGSNSNTSGSAPADDHEGMMIMDYGQAGDVTPNGHSVNGAASVSTLGDSSSVITVVDEDGDASLADDTGDDDDDDDWGYGVPPLAVHEIEGNTECGIDESEMGGLLKVKGIGLPERYGHVEGGILKNRVKGISGGKPIGSAASGTVVVEGQGKASVKAGASKLKRRVAGGIAWLDTLNPAEARSRHQRVPKASIDGFQHHHLVGVKFFKKEDVPVKISVAVLAGAQGGAGSSSGEGGAGGAGGARGPSGSAERDVMSGSGAGGAAGPDRRRGVSPSPDGSGPMDLDDSSNNNNSAAGDKAADSFAAQRLKERLKEHDSVRAALASASAASSSLAHTRLLAQGVSQGGQPGLALYHHSKFRMSLSPKLSQAAQQQQAGKASTTVPIAIPEVELSEGLRERLSSRSLESEAAAAMGERVRNVPRAEYAYDVQAALGPAAPRAPLLDAGALQDAPGSSLALQSAPGVMTAMPAPLPQYMLLPRAPPKPQGAAGAAGSTQPQASAAAPGMARGFAGLIPVRSAGPAPIPVGMQPMQPVPVQLTMPPPGAVPIPAGAMPSQLQQQQQQQQPAQQSRFGPAQPQFAASASGPIPIPIPIPSTSPQPNPQAGVQPGQGAFPVGQAAQGASASAAAPVGGGGGLANLLSGLKSLVPTGAAAALQPSGMGAGAPQAPGMAGAGGAPVSLPPGAIPIPTPMPVQQGPGGAMGSRFGAPLQQQQPQQPQQQQPQMMMRPPPGAIPIPMPIPGGQQQQQQQGQPMPIPVQVQMPGHLQMHGAIPVRSSMVPIPIPMPMPVQQQQQQQQQQQPMMIPAGAIPIPMPQPQQHQQHQGGMMMMPQPHQHQIPPGAIPVGGGAAMPSAGAGPGHRAGGGGKYCLFFTTRQGCRKGAGCPFIHDAAFVPSVDDLRAISKR